MTDRKFTAFLLTIATLFCAAAWGCLSAGLPQELSAPRSACWRKVRAEYLEKVGNRCEACSTKEEIEVHHVIPFATDPSKECDPTNLIALCRAHHFDLGHARSFHHFNPNVREDAKRFREMIANRVPNE